MKIKFNQKLVESFLLSFLITALVASIARLFTNTQSAWYLALNKPVLQPPAIVFPIVWTIIYILIAISLGLVIYSNAKQIIVDSDGSEKEALADKSKVYILYAIQGVLNILWCIVFFTLKMPAVAFALIVVYLVVVYLTMREAYKFNPWAAYLQIPYLLWLVYATALNYLIVLIN